MLQKIMDMLNTSTIISVDGLAKKFNIDRESVLAALEQLQRMGYIADIASQACDSGQCGISCNGCNGCNGASHKLVGCIYSIR